MDFTNGNGFFHRKRSRQAKYWMYETINETLKENFYNDETIQHLLAENERKVLNSEISSFVAAKNMLDYYFGKK